MQGAPDCQAQLAFVLGLKPLGIRGLGLKYDQTDKENNHFTAAATLKTFNRQMVYYIIYNYDFSNILMSNENAPPTKMTISF